MRLYSFDDVVGNSNIIPVIRQSLVNKTFPQITIFSGIYGTGKSTCAEIASLSLTCDNPDNGNPCLVCDKCIGSINALQKTGENTRIIKKNVGQKNTKADVDAMIKDIFILKASEDAVVYIIEEAHSLSDSQQTALLEELDKIPKGVYVIFCTTKITKLIPELRSRAINYAFSRISDAEASLLLDRLCVKRKFPISFEAKKIIISHSRGIPRQLTNLYDFVASGQYKTETLAAFLGVINEGDFISLFEATISDDMFIYSNTLDQFIKSYPLDSFIEQLKEFILKAVFLLEGNIKEGLSSEETNSIRSIFANTDILKIASSIGNIPNNASEADFKFAMLRIRQQMHNKNLGDIVKDKAVVAAAQKSKASAMYTEHTVQKREELNNTQMKGLSMAFLNQFGGDT